MNNKCIFCLQSNKLFDKIEHIIPESMGGEETVPTGFVCDQCNSYFGQKIEEKVLSQHLIFSRILSGVKTKKRKYPNFENSVLKFQNTKKNELLVRVKDTQVFNRLKTQNHMALIVKKHEKLLIRFLLKIGLEFLIDSKKINVYDKILDNTRIAARNPKSNSTWEIGEIQLDFQNTVKENILYQWSLYFSKNLKEIIFVFQYFNQLFAIPLLSNKFGFFAKDAFVQDNKQQKEFIIKEIKLA